ncbi:MAG TPA: 50S ribosomal protein L32 [Candidatus Saccharimonadales bacterium]|nr:50S ribosomal protein L32 [Candidatus Saccharimonadales bacterium]
MAEPKKKLSKTRTNRRRAQYKVEVVDVALCKNCGKPARPHYVCPHCGFYKGESVKKHTPTKRIVLDEKS